jgi:hypothetical protein
MIKSNNSTSVAAINLGAVLDTSELHVLAPGSNVRTGWAITFAGPGHAQTVAFSNAKERQRLALEARIEAARTNGRRWKPDDRQPDEVRRTFIEDLTARIVTWTPVDVGDGPIEFSQEAAVVLLLNPKMGFAVSQITEFLLDERSFTKGSAKP